MTATDLRAIEEDLRCALVRRYAQRARRRRRLFAGVLACLAACGLSAIALAGGFDGDLRLDPAKWSILGGGSVDDGRGAYVHAARRSDGSPSTFLVEHDAGLPAYQRFVLHENTLAAARASSPVAVHSEKGALCTPGELARAETIALTVLRAEFPAGTPSDITRQQVDEAIRAAFASPCMGLEYAGEQARSVFSGIQPASSLMPDAR